MKHAICSAVRDNVPDAIDNVSDHDVCYEIWHSVKQVPVRIVADYIVGDAVEKELS